MLIKFSFYIMHHLLKMYTITAFLVCAIFVVAMPSRIEGEKPWIEEHPDSVIFRTKICQPVPEDELQSMLGPDYDPEKMAPLLSQARQLVRRHQRSLDHANPGTTATPVDKVVDDTADDFNWFLRRLQHRTASGQLQLPSATPWECKMVYRTLQNAKGIFPQFVVGGECLTKRCFYNLYQCEPVRYAVKVLQKDTSSCNPVPAVANATIYQERWKLHTIHVTVACNCVTPYAMRSQLQRNLPRKGG